MQSPCRHRQARRLASIVALITLSSGCSISGFVSDDDAAERVDASTTTVQASTQVFTDMGSDFRGIIDDVNLKECPTAKGESTASGTVKNTSDEAADILIGVIWLRGDTGDSVATAEFTAKGVAAGASIPWSVTKDLPEAAGRCVLQAKSNVVGTIG